MRRSRYQVLLLYSKESNFESSCHCEYFNNNNCRPDSTRRMIERPAFFRFGCYSRPYTVYSSCNNSCATGTNRLIPYILYIVPSTTNGGSIFRISNNTGQPVMESAMPIYPRQRRVPRSVKKNGAQTKKTCTLFLVLRFQVSLRRLYCTLDSVVSHDHEKNMVRRKKHHTLSCIKGCRCPHSATRPGQQGGTRGILHTRARLSAQLFSGRTDHDLYL